MTTPSDLRELLASAGDAYLNSDYRHAAELYANLLAAGLRRCQIYSNYFQILFRLGQLKDANKVYDTYLDYLFRRKNFVAAFKFKKLLDELSYRYDDDDFNVFSLLSGDYTKADLYFGDISSKFLQGDFSNFSAFELLSDIDFTKKLPISLYQLKLWQGDASYSEIIQVLYYQWYYYGDSLFAYYFLADISLHHKRITFEKSLTMFFSQGLYKQTPWNNLFFKIEAELAAFFELRRNLFELGDKLPQDENNNLLKLLEDIDSTELNEVIKTHTLVKATSNTNKEISKLEQSIIKILEKDKNSLRFLSFALLSGLYNLALSIIENIPISQDINEKIDYYYLKIEVLTKLGKYYLAKEELETILGFEAITDDEKIMFRYQLAEVLYGLQHFDEAYKIYKELENTDYRLVNLRLRDLEQIQ